MVKFSGKAEFEGLFVTWSQDRLSRPLSSWYVLLTFYFEIRNLQFCKQRKTKKRLSYSGHPFPFKRGLAAAEFFFSFFTKMLHNIVQFPNSVLQKMKRRELVCNNSDFAKQSFLLTYRRHFKFRTYQVFTYRFLKGRLLYFSTNSLNWKTVEKRRKTVQPRALHGNSKYSPAFQLGDYLSLLSRCLFRLALLFCCFLESEN